MNDEAIYDAAQASEMTGLSQPTIRKYCQTLTRECNYEFTVINQRGDRRFSKADIEILSAMKDLSTRTNMNVSAIARVIVTRYLDPKPSKSQTALQPVSEINVLVQEASRSYWEQARRELAEEISSEVSARVREEIRQGLETEFSQLRSDLASEFRTMMQEVAATQESNKKRWWQLR